MRLHHEWFGPPAGDVVMLNNGVFMSTASWAFQIPALAAHYRVLAYDMRGQGQSDHPDGEYSMEIHAADLVRLMDTLAIERAHLVGTSYGGELNLMMGVRHPDRCRSLTVIASVSHSEPPLAATIARWRSAAATGDASHFFSVIHPDVYSPRFREARPELLALAQSRAATFDLAAAIRLMRSFDAFDLSRDLHVISMPTCIISAADDTLKPPQYGEFLHRHIQGSEFHLIPDAGHAVVLERPDVVNALVLEFLSRHS